MVRLAEQKKIRKKKNREDKKENEFDAKVKNKPFSIKKSGRNTLTKAAVKLRKKDSIID